MKNEDLYVYKKSDFYEDFISSQKEYYEREQVDTLLAEKDREIAELYKKLMPCINGDCILTCEVVEKYGKENAELKAKLDEYVLVKLSIQQMLQNLIDCGLIKEWYFNGKFNIVLTADDPHLQIAQLKQKLHDAEMRADLAEAAETERKIDYDNLKKDLAYHARQIYFKHNRQTLRALWLARAYRAGHCASVFYFVPSEYLNTPLNIYGYADKDIGMERMLKPRRWMKIWNNVERLCRAKADTFKEDK